METIHMLPPARTDVTGKMARFLERLFDGKRLGITPLLGNRFRGVA